MAEAAVVAAAKRKVVTFLALLLLLAIPGYLIEIAGVGPGMMLTLASPAVAGLATRLIYQRDVRGVGWGWGRSRYAIVAYILPVAILFLAYGIIWLTGIGIFSVDGFTDYISTATSGTFVSPISGILVVATISFLYVSALVSLEEIGWRGLLVPELAKFNGYAKTSLISGLIWAVWHYPLFIFLRSNGAPVWHVLVVSTVTLIAASFFVNWLRLRSGSIWPAIIVHASNNVFAGNLFAPLTVQGAYTSYLSEPIVAAATVLAAYIFWRYRGSLPSALGPSTTDEGAKTSHAMAP